MSQLIFTKEFQKHFDKIKDRETKSRILKKILELKNNPFLGRMLTAIEDHKYGKLYRLRIGNYRIIYAVKHETSEIYIITLGHRKSIYNDIAR